MHRIYRPACRLLQALSWARLAACERLHWPSRLSVLFLFVCMCECILDELVDGAFVNMEVDGRER